MKKITLDTNDKSHSSPRVQVSRFLQPVSLQLSLAWRSLIERGPGSKDLASVPASDDSFPEWPGTFPRTSWCLPCSASGTEPASACLPGRWEHTCKTPVRSLNIKLSLVYQIESLRVGPFSRKYPRDLKRLNFRDYNSASQGAGSVFGFLLFVYFYGLFLGLSINSLIPGLLLF